MWCPGLPGFHEQFPLMHTHSIKLLLDLGLGLFHWEAIPTITVISAVLAIPLHPHWGYYSLLSVFLCLPLQESSGFYPDSRQLNSYQSTHKQVLGSLFLRPALDVGLTDNSLWQVSPGRVEKWKSERQTHSNRHAKQTKDEIPPLPRSHLNPPPPSWESNPASK